MKARALTLAIAAASGCDLREPGSDCDIELPVVARLGSASAVPADRVIGTRCVDGPEQATPDTLHRVSFDRATSWGDVAAAIGKVDPDERSELEIAARGIFGVAVLGTAPTRRGPSSFASKAESEAAACWGSTVFATADGLFVSEVRRDRAGGRRRRACCFDPDMPTRRSAKPPSPLCPHRPIDLDELDLALEQHRDGYDRCEFLVLSAQRSLPWEDVVSLLARLGDHTVLLEDGGGATCPEGLHRPQPGE